MQRLVWDDKLKRLVPDRSGHEMVIRMLNGMASGLSRAEIVAREMDILRHKQEARDANGHE